MKYIFMVLLLASCAEFPIDAKMKEMQKLNCQPPDVALCAGWQI